MDKCTTKEDKGDTVDENDPRMTKMYDGRQVCPGDLETCGFELSLCPTEVMDFRDDEEVTSVYYEEMRQVSRKADAAGKLHEEPTTTPTPIARRLLAACQEAIGCGPRLHLRPHRQELRGYEPQRAAGRSDRRRGAAGALRLHRGRSAGATQTTGRTHARSDPHHFQ